MYFKDKRRRKRPMHSILLFSIAGLVVTMVCNNPSCALNLGTTCCILTCLCSFSRFVLIIFLKNYDCSYQDPSTNFSEMIWNWFDPTLSCVHFIWVGTIELEDPRVKRSSICKRHSDAQVIEWLWDQSSIKCIGYKINVKVKSEYSLIMK